jgi:hypothetical protein
MSQQPTKISFKYILVALMAVLITWVIHELAHWCTGELLGNQMVMTLNTAYPKAGKYSEEWHSTIISAAGPAITLIQALGFYFLLKRSSSNLLFPFLLTCLYMRSLAGVMNFINLNDEGRISKDLGLGSFVLPFLVFGILFYLVYSTTTTKEYRANFIAISVLLIMLFSSILILSDQAWKMIIL